MIKGQRLEHTGEWGEPCGPRENSSFSCNCEEAKAHVSLAFLHNCNLLSFTLVGAVEEVLGALYIGHSSLIGGKVQDLSTLRKTLSLYKCSNKLCCVGERALSLFENMMDSDYKRCC